MSLFICWLVCWLVCWLRRFPVMEIKRNYLRLISRTMAVVAAAVMATAAAFDIVMVTRGSKKNIFYIPYLLRFCLLVATFSGRGRQLRINPRSILRR